MLPLLPILLNLLKLEEFKCRPLTEGEIHLCKCVFGELIDYSTVRIMNQPFIPWQSQHAVMAPSGYIHALNLHYKNDYAKESTAYQALLIHEMAHIYQYQHGVNVLVRGAILQSAFFISLRTYNPYHYTLKPNKSFADYNIEQQGDIARDIFLKKIPNIILHPELAPF
ncbi:hypothetical protein [Acinetobacter tianfuensis]|uniref:DUF4157 domain-containing protein n=1 Tax=Acinetobacter tianfuensis TaxID=2419603 RepID=A0A3A8E6V4_9GAMM|nr:hypothetical protein [Acinetobacter tianfuensis]RKG29316.1 hypothetical protein D7V32_15535 [Acinetobacter tianfuensis]